MHFIYKVFNHSPTLAFLCLEKVQSCPVSHFLCFYCGADFSLLTSLARGFSILLFSRKKTKGVDFSLFCSFIDLYSLFFLFYYFSIICSSFSNFLHWSLWACGIKNYISKICMVKLPNI